MGLISSLQKIKPLLQDTKLKFYEAAKLNNLEAKETTTLSEYVDIFKTHKSSAWQYPSDWIDVHKVLEEDEYDKTAYPYGRAVILLLNNQETTTFSLSLGSTSTPKAIKTSDGAFYTYADNGSSVTHTWQTGEEKTCWVIYYYSKAKCYPVHKTYLPTNALYIYIDSSSFMFSNDYSPSYTSFPYLQGLECTKESIYTDSGSYLGITALEYVYLPFDKEKSTNTSYLIYNNMFLKYFYASIIPSDKIGKSVNAVNWDNGNWSSLNSTAIVSGSSITYQEGVADLSNYTSDTAVNLFYNAYNNINIKVKLPNAPVTCYLGQYCASVIKPSTWEYMAENAPVVDGRTLTLNTYGYASLKAAGKAYQTFIDKGWVIK